jgi:tol-pal system protein YbgF
MRRPLALFLTAPLLLASTSSWALFGNEDLQRRLERLEQRLGSDNSTDMVMQLERMQREVQQLRGELETQQHALDALSRRQQDQYRDLEQRLGGGGGGSPTGSGASGARGGGVGGPKGGGLSSGPPPVDADPAATMLPSPESATEAKPIRADQRPQPPATSGPIAQSSLADPHQEAAYKTAFEQLKSGQYGKAIQSFKGFVSAYPSGSYADNAQFWLGEAYYVQKEYDNALTEFDKVLRNYPRSTKVPDALLKMAYIQSDKQNWKQANSLLNKLVKEYPDSTSAGLGRKQLERLRQEGH